MSQNNPPTEHMLTRDQAARVVYEDLKQSERATFDVASQYGRWLISTLVIINGGALAGLLTFLDGLASESDTLARFAHSIWCFVAGVILALMSGMMAWMNWSAHAANFGSMARHDMLWDPKVWPKSGDFDRRIEWTYRASILFGLSSATAAVLGAAFALHGPALEALITRLLS